MTSDHPAIGTLIQVQTTVQAAMRCEAITPEIVRAYEALPSSVGGMVFEAIAETLHREGLNAKNLTVVGKLFTAGVNLAVRRSA